MLLGNEQKRRRRGSNVHPATYVLVAVAILFSAFALITLVRGGGDDSSSLSEDSAAPVPEQVAPGVPQGSSGETSQKAFDPLAFDPADTANLQRRAAAGYAH